jgi:protein-disulfide isomerase-like protein with CxxC motif
MRSSFDVTWDYLCPFARNAHEHLAEALRGGAEWDVRFRFFSLAQVHLKEDRPPVWDDPAANSGVLAGLAGIVVRERQPEKFLDAHMALFAARHNHSLDLRNSEVVAGALNGAGLDGESVVEEALNGWAVDKARAEHEEAVQRWEVFGVPTFITEEKAVFVRLMSRPEGDSKLAEKTVERVLELVGGFPDLNEYKFSQIPR